MKVLLSAYACEPNKGSESELGWKTMKHLAGTCTQLTVITKKSSRQAISNSYPTLGIINTRFIYYDMPCWINELRKNHLGMQVHAYLWEIGVFFYLLKKFRKNEFDLVHKGTIGSFRFPSLAWYFGKQFTWGPLSSGEKFPFKFLSVFSWKGKILELLRLSFRRLALWDPLVLLTLYKAHKIIALTSDTKEYLPAFARKKTVVETNRHISVDFSAFDPVCKDALQRKDKLRLLYIGRLLEWKGIILVLKALAELGDSLDYEFTIMGDGPALKHYQQYVKKHGLNVNFISPQEFPRRSLSSFYLTHDLFVFPGLRGTGSTVMMEANLHKLPVLILDITAPDAYDSIDFGIKIQTKDRNVPQVISHIAQELLFYQQTKQSRFCNLPVSSL